MPKICFYCARYPDSELTIMPVGIGYIASYLMEKKLASKDDILFADTLEEIILFHPDILGVSSVTQVISDAVRVAKKCKQAFNCLTVLGGYHVTCFPNGLPGEFDIGVIGEGEETFAEIVKMFSNKFNEIKHLGKINGICYRENGDITKTLPRALIEDIDSLPWPYRYKRYSTDEPVFTSRGCPYHCTYCASNTFWKGRTRFRSSESVVNEILDIVDKYHPKEIAILDDLWIADKKRFREIVEKLVENKIPEKVTFRGFCRSNIVDEETMVLFKKLNYSHVRFGAETGSDMLLKKIKGSGITVADHQRVIDLSHKYGLWCGASFMFGIPGETYKDIEHTVNFLKKNKDRFGIMGLYFFNPMPGTPLWDELARNGKIKDDLNYDQYQLDFLNPQFSWDNVLYFNEENIPLKNFRNIIEKIKEEFVLHSEEDTDKKLFLLFFKKIFLKMLNLAGLITK